MEQTKPVSTFRPEDGHGGTEEHETPGIVRHRYYAGYGDTSGENQVPAHRQEVNSKR
jgi:hypothetical protein